MEIYVGMEFTNKKGFRWRVKEIIDMRNIVVESLEWMPYTTTIRKEAVVKGIVMYPYGKHRLGGYRGEGKWNASKSNPHFPHWNSLFPRCYESNEDCMPTYTDCVMDESWHNLQNYCNWSEKNYPKDTHGFKWELDKDLLGKGSKVYGPDTCCYLPKELNLFLARMNDAGIYEHVGVDGKIYYRVWVRQGKETDSKQCHYVGSYPTYKGAYEIWKAKKKERHTALCDKYKDVLPEHVYKAFSELM